VLTPEDPYNLRGRESESYTNDRREDDIAMAEANGDIASADYMIERAEVTAEDGEAYIIDTFAVVDSGEDAATYGEDAATSSRQRPSVLRRLGHDLDLNAVAASQAALSQGRPPPEGTENALVVTVPHGDILSDFRNNNALKGAFGHLFPVLEDRLAQLVKEVFIREMAPEFAQPSRLVLAERQGYSFLCCRHHFQARISIQYAVQTTVRGKMSADVAEKIAQVKSRDLMSMAADPFSRENVQ